MRILLVAPLERPESTAHLISKAFHGLGHEVEEFDYRKEYYSTGLGKMNDTFKNKLKEYFWDDLLLVIKGEGIEKATLEKAKIKKALWHFDFNSHKISNETIAGVAAFHYVFLMCYPWVQILRDNGINAFFLPQATDPSVYRPTKPRPEFLCDVAFIGSNKPTREDILNKVAEKFNTKAFGNGWNENLEIDGKFASFPPAYLDDFNSVCASAKVILNITPSDDWPIYEKTFSQRVYMVMSAGGYLVTDKVPGMELSNLTVYPNAKEITATISDVLSSSDNFRNHIKKHAREEILQRHTYYHRIKEMMKCLRL